MNNWDIYKLVNYIINKEQSGNTFTPEEFQLLLNTNSMMLLRNLLGLPESYGIVPTTKYGYGKSTHINDSVKPFIVSDYQLQVVNGKAIIPEDYYYWISSTIYSVLNVGCKTPKEINSLVELCSKNEFDARKSGFYAVPDSDYPIMTFYQGNIEVLPKWIKTVNMTYVKYPVEAEVYYTINNDGVVVYDEFSSTELEWAYDEKITLATMILKNVAINLRSSDVMAAQQQMQ